MFCLTISILLKILLIFTISNHIPSYCSYPITRYALCPVEPEVPFPLQSITSFSSSLTPNHCTFCPASYTLLIRVTAAQLPPRRGHLWTKSSLCSQLSHVCTCCLMGNVVPESPGPTWHLSVPFLCLFFPLPFCHFPFSTDFPRCVTLVKYLKQIDLSSPGNLQHTYFICSYSFT